MIKDTQLGKSPRGDAMFQRVSEKPVEARREGKRKVCG
jgi:hypothetical protein